MQSDDVFEQKICAWANDRLEREVGFRLLVDVLDDRLDDDVAGVQVIELRGAGEVGEGPLLVLRRHFSLVDAALKELLDPSQAFLDERVLDLADDGFVARRRRRLARFPRPSARSRGRRLS